MAELSVELTAKINRLERDLKKARKELVDLGETAEKTQKKTSNVGSRSATQINKFSKSTANATPTLQEFGRVLSDAPFGIRGVGNNIEQLVSNFQNLKKQTGSSKAAFSSLIASLSGPGGILIAVSAVTAGLTALAQSGTTLTDVLNFFAGSSNDAAKAQRDLAEASKDAVGNAQQETTTLNTLLAIAKDKEKSDTVRARALAKINDEYGEFLPNLSKENVNTNAVTAAVDKYNASLLRQAKIKGAQNLISEEFAKILELESKSAIDNANALDILAAGFQSVGQNQLLVSNVVSKGFQRQQKEISEAEKRIQSFQKTLQGLLTEDLQVGGIETSVKGQDRKVTELGRSLGENLNKLRNSLSNVQLDFTSPVTQELDKLGLIFPAKIAQINQVATTEWQKLTNNINRLSQNSLSQGISNAFNSFGQAIANGENAIKAFANSLVASFGRFLSDLGKLLIKYGTLGVVKGKLDTAIAAGGPASIAAGFAAIAIGAALSAAGGALGARAQGGFSGGAVSGQGSQSAFSGSNYSAQYETYNPNEFLENMRIEIEGTKLIAVQNRVNSIRRRNNSTLF